MDSIWESGTSMIPGVTASILPPVSSGITFVDSVLGYLDPGSFDLVIPAHNADDFGVLIYFNGDSATNTMVDPGNGWTELRRDAHDNVTATKDCFTEIWYKKLTGSEPTISCVSTNSSDGNSGAIHIFRGVDTVTPFDVTTQVTTGADDTTTSCPAITTVTDNCALLLFNGISRGQLVDAAGLPATPSGLTLGESLINLVNVTQINAYKVDVGTAGTTTPTDWTHTTSGNSTGYINYTIALRPA